MRHLQHGQQREGAVRDVESIGPDTLLSLQLKSSEFGAHLLTEYDEKIALLERRVHDLLATRQVREVVELGVGRHDHLSWGIWAQQGAP